MIVCVCERSQQEKQELLLYELQKQFHGFTFYFEFHFTFSNILFQKMQLIKPYSSWISHQ